MGTEVEKQQIDSTFLSRFLHDDGWHADLLVNADRVLSEKLSDAAVLDMWGGIAPYAFLCLRLAQSRSALLARPREFSIGIVFGMWRETRRLLPWSADNPTGENSLVRKLDALDWLFRDLNSNWRVYAVDDDCPESSQQVARQAIATHGSRDKVSFIHIASSFPYDTMPLSRLTDLSESVKGGAIVLGCQSALADGCDYVFYTDSDNSVHLGQLGSFIETAFSNAGAIVVGDRKLDNPYSSWSPNRETETPSAKVLKHIRGLLGIRMPIRDVFGAFKLFPAASLGAALNDITSFDFCFDFDLVGAALKRREHFQEISALVFDSVEETSWAHFGDEKVWYQKFQGMLHAARRHGLPFNVDTEALIETYLTSPDSIRAVLNSEPPLKLRNAPRSALGDPELMSPKELMTWFANIEQSTGNAL